MSRTTLLSLTWPIVGLSVLLSAACLVSIVSIGRLQSELGESLRADATRLQAAQQVQIHLREYRAHTIILAAGSTATRRQQVEEDRTRFRAALNVLRETSDDSVDGMDLDELESGWLDYENKVNRNLASPPSFQSVEELAVWADTHPLRALLVPCQDLVERAQERMDRTTAKSAVQTRLAGRGLLAVGLIGPLAGLVGGYMIARKLSNRVARLSVRVRAVQSHLDQEVGAMTLNRPDSLADLDTQLERVVERVRDVCRRVQEQERDLLRAEQLSAVGHLAAGVAHEIRNPLTGIKMLVESAIRPVAPTPLDRADLEMMRDEIARLERAIQGLLNFAKPPIAIRQASDVRQAIARAIGIVASRATASGTIVESELGEIPLMARLDADQFTSLMTNLLLNAIDVTPRDGRVWIEAGFLPEGRIRVTVNDTGPGIANELAKKLFTPFTTSKPTGTGLGLAVARRVAEDHGGTLTAANRTGGGACFTVTIPAEEGGDAEVIGRR